MKIGVIGAGAWGSALSFVLSKNVENSVLLWSHDGELNKFDNASLPQNLQIFTDMSFLMDTDIWFVVTPAAFFRETMLKAKTYYNKQDILICTKGMEPKTHCFMSEILTQIFGDDVQVGVLAGPQFAYEVAKGIKTGSTLAGPKKLQENVSKALSNLYLTYTDDIIGVQICGVGKNATAFITGYMSITATGENERALIFTQVWNEIVKLGLSFGAKADTFLDLCGIGDLFLSATSMTSRNFSAGVALAQKKPLLGTIEGISAIDGLVYRAKQQRFPLETISILKERMNL